MNELLQRKHAWTPNDLERFTELYRSDHTNEQLETAAQANLTAVEKQVEEAGQRLSASILARYHEEQIWSDKIRRMSTWGTWGLMGMNILLFLVFQIGVEPWRRKRLVKGFEDKVMEALEREGSVVGNIPMEMNIDRGTQTVSVEEKQETELAAEEPIREGFLLVDELALPDTAGREVHSSVNSDLPAGKPLSKFERMREGLRDMFSEHQITIRRVDLTTAMLEGTAAGVAFVGVLVLLLRPK